MSAIINGGKPVELLLVEDNAEEAELTMETLREGRIPNLRVHWVEDGEEAMAFLRRASTVRTSTGSTGSRSRVRASIRALRWRWNLR